MFLFAAIKVLFADVHISAVEPLGIRQQAVQQVVLFSATMYLLPLNKIKFPNRQTTDDGEKIPNVKGHCNKHCRVVNDGNAKSEQQLQRLRPARWALHFCYLFKATNFDRLQKFGQKANNSNAQPGKQVRRCCAGVESLEQDGIVQVRVKEHVHRGPGAGSFVRHGLFATQFSQVSWVRHTHVRPRRALFHVRHASAQVGERTQRSGAAALGALRARFHFHFVAHFTGQL